MENVLPFSTLYSRPNIYIYILHNRESSYCKLNLYFRPSAQCVSATAFIRGLFIYFNNAFMYIYIHIYIYPYMLKFLPKNCHLRKKKGKDKKE